MFKFAVLLILIIAAACAEDAENSKSVIIVGAGLAGYSAAARLMEKGFTDIKIFEAENRVGGRIHSIDYSDGKIDLGAQWVHGQGGNIVYQNAKDFPYGTTPFDTIDQRFVDSNQAVLNQRLLNNLSSVIYKDVLEGRDEELAAYNGSMGGFIWETFTSLFSESPYANTDSQLIEKFKNHIEREQIGHHAANSLNDVSAKLNSKFADASGNQHQTWKKSGFFTYFNYITKNGALNIASKTELGKKVTNIAYSTGTGNKVTVTTADQIPHTADHVIFTGSLGVLKRFHASLFTPVFTSERITAINANAFGAIAKLFLHFDAPFWPSEDFVSYSFLWNEAQRSEAVAAGRGWLQGIPSAFIVDQYPNLFEIFIGGEKVAENESVSNEKVLDDIVWFFEKFLGRTIPRPTIAGRTNWLSNENFLGTYTYLSMSAENAKVGSKDLAKSIVNANGKPVVLFAGEATDYDYPSFAHGAVTSGNRAADELVAFYASLTAPPVDYE